MQSLLVFVQKRKKLLLIAGGIFVTGLIIWRIMAGQNNKTPYQTAKVERGAIVSTVSTSGTVLSANIIKITTQASGTVNNIYVKDEQLVKKGDKILEVSLDQEGEQQNAQAWSSYLSAKNSLSSVEATAYSLQSDMFAKWDTFFNLATNSTYQNADGSTNETNRALPEFHIAQDDWLATEAKYKNQQAVITQAQSALNSAWLSYQLSSPTVTAPMDGTVNNLVVVEGMVINGSSGQSTTSGTNNAGTNQQIAVIQNDNLPLASYNLSEVDVTRVKSGMKATVTLDSIQGKTFTGQVMTVDRIGTVSSGVTSYPVIIRFDTGAPQILPNMSTSANIIIDSKGDVLLVPSAVIQTIGDQSYVRVLINGKEQQVPVETGLSLDTQTEVVSGLKEGDTVITGTQNSSTTTTSSSPFSGGFVGTRGGSGNFRLGR